MDWNNLQADYERLGSFKAVAKAYGVAPETVSRKAKELRLHSRRRWRTESLDPAEIRKLYEGGTTAARGRAVQQQPEHDLHAPMDGRHGDASERPA